MSGKSLERVEDADSDEGADSEEEGVVKIESPVEKLVREALGEIIEEETPEEREERESLEKEIEEKFPEENAEGEPSEEGVESLEVEEGESPEGVVPSDDLSVNLQLLKGLTASQTMKGRGGGRAVTESFGVLRRKSKERRRLSLAEQEEEVRLAESDRPRMREDCMGGQRPCPWVGCRYHLYLDVNPGAGSIRYNFPGLEVGQLPVSCSLDVADAGSLVAEEVAVLLNITRQGVGFIVDRALDEISRSRFGAELMELFNEE